MRRRADPPLSSPVRNRRSHAVLARVSSGYPPLLGGFLRVTHPSATLLAPEGTFSFDLHVLGLPPTFNLSHDQTLQFKKFSGSAAIKTATAPKTSLPRLFVHERPHEWLVSLSMSRAARIHAGQGERIIRTDRSLTSGVFRSPAKTLRDRLPTATTGRPDQACATRCQLFLPRRMRW